MIEGRVNKRILLEKIRSRDGLVCGICGGKMDAAWERYITWLNSPKSKLLKRSACDITLDHKVSRSALRQAPDFVYVKGWQWKDLDNLQIAHLSCNIKKANA